MAKVKKKNTKLKTKKSVTKKPTRKQREKKRKRIIQIIIGMIAMIFAVLVGYYLGMQQSLVPLPQINKQEKRIEKKEHTIDKTNKVAKKPQVKKSVVKKTVKKKVVQKKRIEKKRVLPKKKKHTSHKPRLAIIIDDVSGKRQLRRIVNLKMHITPSLFPPSKLNMRSHRLARGLQHYMIHLPMESGSKQFNSQYKTLLTSFSKKQMHARVKELRRLFPHARYINNHTGSIFTANYKAMYQLYALLRKEKFVFMDSRTSGRSKVKKISKVFRDRYIARDIFIDNVHTVAYIHKQLKKAVRTAKRRGYAVAIGHPHKVTMKALISAKKILKDVELVYIDRLYKGEK